MSLLKHIIITLAFIVAINVKYFYFVNGADTLRQREVAVDVDKTHGFKSIELSEQDLETLNADKVLNGEFAYYGDVRFSLFNAVWNSGKTKLKVTHHTPEVCWLGSGWEIVDLGQSPSYTFSTANKEVITMDANVFHNKTTDQTEVVLWSVLLNGVAFESDAELRPNAESAAVMDPSTTLRDRSLRSSRMLRINQFLSSLKSRKNPMGTKQFFRISKEYSNDLKRDLDDLKRIFESLIYYK